MKFMDTTKEYILMCEKAEEIQDARYPDFFAGDWYISINGYSFVMGSILPLENDLHRRGEIWLPRQDQLQGMVKELHPNYTSIDWTWTISHWGQNYVNKDYYKKLNLMSMEQLWLAFVMKEKFNKTWNGKEWA